MNNTLESIPSDRREGRGIPVVMMGAAAGLAIADSVPGGLTGGDGFLIGGGIVLAVLLGNATLSAFWASRTQTRRRSLQQSLEKPNDRSYGYSSPADPEWKERPRPPAIPGATENEGG
jgi:hypothetical protein